MKAAPLYTAAAAVHSHSQECAAASWRPIARKLDRCLSHLSVGPWLDLALWCPDIVLPYSPISDELQGSPSVQPDIIITVISLLVLYLVLHDICSSIDRLIVQKMNQSGWSMVNFLQKFNVLCQKRTPCLYTRLEFRLDEGTVVSLSFPVTLTNDLFINPSSD
jgi:hypothetical protein